MRKCDKDGRDCGVCKDACVLTTDAPPPALPRLYAPRPAVIRQCPVSGDACNDCSAWQCQRVPSDAVAAPKAAGITTDSKERKDTPVYSGVLAYFPLALAAVAQLSKAGNDKHNPGQPLHWSKDKSNDHADCIARHLLELGTVDPDDGFLHDVKLAWRALANLQTRLEGGK